MSHQSVQTAARSAAAFGTRWRSHAAVLAFGTFAVGTDAFVIAGVLPSIAGSLQIGIGAAGQLVTVFALAYVVAAPLVGALTSGWPLRRVVLVAITVFVLGNVLTALSPSYPLVLASRIVAALGAAAYTASATATAAELAGDARRGRAIAIVMTGVTSSLVLGAPIGTVLGSALGWRATLWFVAGLGALAAAVLAVRLPARRSAVATVAGLRARLAPLRNRGVIGVLASTFVAFLGIYTPYTYFSAVYEPSTGGSGDRLALLLLVFGLAGTAGNLAAGALADRFGPRRVIVTATLALTAVFAALPLLSLLPALRGSLLVALPVVVVSGALSFSVTTPQQHVIIALAPGAGSMTTSLYQSAAYLSISASGVLGAIGLAVGGAVVLGPLAALPVLLAALLTLRFSSVR